MQSGGGSQRTLAPFQSVPNRHESTTGQKVSLRTCALQRRHPRARRRNKKHTAQLSLAPVIHVRSTLISMQKPSYNLGVLVICQNKGFPKVREPGVLSIPPFPSPQQSRTSGHCQRWASRTPEATQLTQQSLQTYA